MRPFIRYIGTHHCDDAEYMWYNDPCRAFHELNHDAQAYFLLGQSIVLHYFDKLFRWTSQPLVAEYAGYVKGLVSELSASAINNTDVMETVNICKELFSCVYEGDNGVFIHRPLDKAHITHVLFDSAFDKDIPQPCSPNFAVPFISMINATAKCYSGIYIEDRVYAASPDFPILSIRDGVLNCEKRDKYSIGKSFVLDEQVMTSPNLKAYPLLQMYAMTEVEDKDIETIFACIGSMCMHGDLLLMQTSMQRLSYVLFCSVFERSVFCNIDRLSAGDGRCIHPSQMYEALFEFISILHKRCGVSAPDKKLLNSIIERGCCFGNDSDRKRPTLVEYLKQEDPATVSTEMYKAFKNSSLACIEEYDIFSQNFVSSQEAQEDDLDDPSDSAPPEDEGDDENEEAEPDATPDDDPMPEEDSDADTPSDDAAQDDTLDDPDGDTAPDETEGDDDSEDEGSDTQPSSDPPLNTSDPRGIVIKIVSPDDETPDSIIFKEEMGNYLKALLKNPPATMSPQHVQLLTKLWKNWLYALDVQTITKIVAFATKLPVTMKRLTNGDSPQ